MSSLDKKIKVRAKIDPTRFAHYGHRRMRNGDVFYMETEIIRKDVKTGKLVNRALLFDEKGKIILPTWVEAVDKNDPRLSGNQFFEPVVEVIEAVEHVESEAEQQEEIPVRTMDSSALQKANKKMPSLQVDKPKKVLQQPKDVL